jgi:hypothetical protein
LEMLLFFICPMWRLTWLSIAIVIAFKSGIKRILSLHFGQTILSNIFYSILE